MSNLPTQEEIVAAIDAVAAVLSLKFSIPHFDKDDIRQEIAVMALQALPRYDPERGALDSFIFRHASNRLKNVYRDRVRRLDAPCRKCDSGTPCNEDGPCAKYVEWKRRQDSKAAIFCSGHFEEGFEPLARSAVEEDAEVAELLHRVDEEIDLELRSTWLAMRAGVVVSKKQRERVEAAVRDILTNDIGV